MTYIDIVRSIRPRGKQAIEFLIYQPETKMKLRNFALTGVVLALIAGSKVMAAPVCQSSSSDPDGDGWGWENGQSCTVSASGSAAASSTSGSSSGNPVCSSASSDPDGDGWGWENGGSCIVGSGSGSSGGSSGSSSSSSSGSGSDGYCASASSDPDGDGWGWENGQSCLVGSSSSSSSSSSSTGSSTGSSSGSSGSSSSAAGQTVDGVPVCTTTASDLDGDGWGHEGGQSCRVTSATADADAPGVQAAPPPVGAASPGTVNGRPICLTDSTENNNSGYGYEFNQTCQIINGTTATRHDPLVNQRICEPWFEIHYGNYRLQNNTWASDAVYTNNWHQCIEVRGGPGNYIAEWDYNWLGRLEGDEFSVKSYPQVYYGRKTRYNISGSVAETGLPAHIDNLPRFQVSYHFTETGNAERNVALESFFHTSCEADENNKQFELMVWVEKPVVRVPGPKVATAFISGQSWSVHTNPSLGWAYVAFVADNPHNQGSLDWNAFVDWVRSEGPRNNVPRLQNNTCMGAIEIGTETFWGNGTFRLLDFTVTR